MSREAAREIYDRELSPEEFDERLQRMREEDESDTDALIRWFRATYPTARDRLRYVRRMTAAWTRVVPGRGDDPERRRG